MTEDSIKAYKRAFGTMDKIKQVIMLYETAIASLNQAKEFIEKKDFQETYNKVEKAYLIVSGLRDSVDMNTEGTVAQTLVDWYSSLSLRIISINRSQDPKMVDLCIDNLTEMRNAWAEAEVISAQEESEKEGNSGSSESGSEEDYFSNTAPANNSTDIQAAAQGITISI